MWRLIVLAALVISTLSPIATASAAGGHVDKRTKRVVTLDKKARVHPELQYGAQTEPDKPVRVIVQLKDKSLDKKQVVKYIEDLVRKGDKKNTSFNVIASYPMSGTFVIEIPQKWAFKLSEHPYVRYVADDRPVQMEAVDVSKLKTIYEQAIDLPSIWNNPAINATGRGVTVAVLDSGVNNSHPALSNGDVMCVSTNGDNVDCYDPNGHGTHVVGTITGEDPQGRYVGVAPKARVISIKIGNWFGASRESDILNGLQWVFENRVTYNIKVVSLSVSASRAESYTSSAIAAAVEQLWFNGVVVVAAAGNRGDQTLNTQQVWYAPGNDPFVITVGAIDDNGTASSADDVRATYSSKGITQDNFAKPDIMAPGRKIPAPLAGSRVVLAYQHPTQIVDTNYIRLSGTSMATPVVSGVVALLLEKYPQLTPDQVKWLILQTANDYAGRGATSGPAGVIDPVQMFQLAAAGAVGAANAGLVPNSRIDPVSGSAGWTASYWEASYWEASYWEASYWEAASNWESEMDDPEWVAYDPTTDPNFLANLALP